jgi:hypothetical protein
MAALFALFTSQTRHTLQRPLRLPRQDETEWCWAAVGSAIHQFHSGNTLRQCKVADKVTGRADCCAPPGSSPCNDVNTLVATLTRLGNLGPWEQDRVTPEDVDREIQANRPVCCGLAKGNRGHFVIIVGWYRSGVETMLLVKDPLEENFEKPVRYRTLSQGYPDAGWRWRQTYFTST